MEPNASARDEWSQTDFDYYYALLKHRRFDDALNLINAKTISIEMLNDLCFEMARAGLGTQVPVKIKRFRKWKNIVEGFEKTHFGFDDLTKLNIPKGETLFHLANGGWASAASSIRQYNLETATRFTSVWENIAAYDAVTFLLSRRDVIGAVRLAEGMSPFSDDAIEAFAVEATYRLPITEHSYSDLQSFIERISQRYPSIAQKAAKKLWRKYDAATLIVSERKAEVAIELLKYVDSVRIESRAVPFEFRCELLDAKYLPIQLRKKMFDECYAIVEQDQLEAPKLSVNQLVQAACEFKEPRRAKWLLEKLGGLDDPLLVLRVATLLYESMDNAESKRLLDLIDPSKLRRYQREIYVHSLLTIGKAKQIDALRDVPKNTGFDSPKISLLILCYKTNFKNSDVINNFISNNEIELGSGEFAEFARRGNVNVATAIARPYIADGRDSWAATKLGDAIAELMAQDGTSIAIQFATALKEAGVVPNFSRFGYSKEIRKLPSQELSAAYGEFRKLFPDDASLNEAHFNLIFDMKTQGQEAVGFEYLGSKSERKLFWNVRGKIRSGHIDAASQIIAASKANFADDFYVGWIEEFALGSHIDEIIKTADYISDSKKRAENLVYFAGALATERFNGEALVPIYAFDLDLRNRVYVPFSID